MNVIYSPDPLQTIEGDFTTITWRKGKAFFNFSKNHFSSFSPDLQPPASMDDAMS
jgi:hypothetical protein